MDIYSEYGFRSYLHTFFGPLCYFYQYDISYISLISLLACIISFISLISLFACMLKFCFKNIFLFRICKTSHGSKVKIRSKVVEVGLTPSYPSTHYHSPSVVNICSNFWFILHMFSTKLANTPICTYAYLVFFLMHKLAYYTDSFSPFFFLSWKLFHIVL